jgi:hypothetical protein
MQLSSKFQSPAHHTMQFNSGARGLIYIKKSEKYLCRIMWAKEKGQKHTVK